MTDEFKEYAQQIVNNAEVFAIEFMTMKYKVISNGTQNHMFVLDVYNTLGITGKEAEEALDKINITVNKNQIPNDTLPPLKSSGLRIGTPAMTTKGFKQEDFIEVAHIINDYLTQIEDFSNIKEAIIEEYSKKVNDLINKVKER